jgi:hypothetical protein
MIFPLYIILKVRQVIAGSLASSKGNNVKMFNNHCRWLIPSISPQRPGFASGSVHIGFVVDKVALCISPTSPCRYGAVAIPPPPPHTHTRSRFAALIVAVVGNMSSWISGIFTCDWITTCRNSLVYSKQTNKQRNTVTRAVPGTEIYTLYWATTRAEVLCYSGRRLGPKCRFGAGNQNSLSLPPNPHPHPYFQIIPKSCELLLVFPCLFPTFLGRLFWRDYGDGLYGSCPSEVPFQDSAFRLTCARLLGDSIPREEQSETEFRTRNR